MEHALTAMEQEDVPCVQAEENGKITTEYIMIAVYVMAEDNAQVVMAEDNAQVVMAVENYANIKERRLPSRLRQPPLHFPFIFFRYCFFSLLLISFIIKSAG